MGFFNWFSGSSKSKLPPDSVQAGGHSTLMRQDVTRPGSLKPQIAGASSKSVSANVLAERLEQRRSERNARRELLFQVVRESMVRVGILSSAFKFKVLALDQRGRTFLVMIDLSAKFGVETGKLAEIEALIAQSAKTRFEMVVQAVYWRFPEMVGASATSPTAASAPLAGVPPSRPAPVQPAHSVAAQPVANASPASGGSDPIEQDEVDAFKRALAAGVHSSISPVRSSPAQTPVQPALSAAAVAAASAKAASMAAINNKLLLTGYEDTEMRDPDEPAPALSATQYGELR